MRLAGLAAGVALVALLVSRGEVSPALVRDWAGSYGTLAPLAFVPLSVCLSCALVPGPLLAGASGLLFGPALGGLVSLVSATLSALLAWTIARVLGRRGVRDLSGRRLDALATWLERRGFWAVLTARLAPGIPDAAVSYAAGLTGVRARSIAAGTVVGAAPRAWAYAALGGSLTDFSSPLATLALAVIVVTGLVGAELVRRQVRRSGVAAAAVREAAR